MEKMFLTPEQLVNILANNEYVGRGTSGMIIKLDDNNLLKFKYKDFISVLNYKDGKFSITNVNGLIRVLSLHKNVIDIMSKDGIFSEIDFIEELIAKQPNIKKTSLTQGIVYCNGCMIGYLLKYHKNMVNLYDYLKENDIKNKEKKIILSNIKDAMVELIKNGIYLKDFTMHNVMFDPKTQDVQIIDFEDAASLREPNDKNGIKLMESQFKDIKSYISTKSLSL